MKRKGGINMPSPEKFKETLENSQLSQDIIDDIYHGYGELKTKTEKKVKAAFFKQALEVMNEKLPSEKVKEIIEANACCKSGIREINFKEFARINKNHDIVDRLKLINSRPYLYMGRVEIDGNGTLIVNAVSYHKEDKFECACPTISKIKRDYSIPREYCYC